MSAKIQHFYQLDHWTKSWPLCAVHISVTSLLFLSGKLHAAFVPSEWGLSTLQEFRCLAKLHLQHKNIILHSILADIRKHWGRKFTTMAC